VIKIYILIAVIGLVGGVCYGGYYYYKDTQQRIQVLTENNAKLETAKKLQDDTIKAMIEDREKFEKLNKELQFRLQAANEYKDTLISKLRKHNLLVLTLKKPAMIEKRINDGTKKLFKSIEDMSIVNAPAPSNGVQ
jgi:D-arabinose 1-dehydrogenase-like Zn-dependent alcohol dehydrogenase